MTKETQRQHWTQEEVIQAIARALENEPEGPNRDYWMTDCMVAEIRKKYRLKRLKPDPLNIVLVRPCCGKQFVHLLKQKKEAKSLKDPRCMEPECRLKVLVMPFGKFAGLTVPLVYEQQPSYLAWFH
jgi:hypothetical protein